MRDEFITKVISKLDGLSPDQVDMVHKVLVECASDYDISLRETSIVPADAFVPNYFSIFLAKKALAGKSVGTIKLYRYYLMDFFLNKPAPIDEMDTTLMLKYLFEVQQRKHICNNTLERIRIMLNVFFEWAYNEGYIKKNFVKNVDPIKYVEKPRKALTEEEEEVLRDACETYRERAILDMLLATGIRISECANMKWSDIDMDKRTIVVFGKGSKFRTVFFNSKAKVSLLRYKAVRPGNSEYVFSQDRAPYNGMTKAGIHRVIKLIVERSGLPSDSISAHVMRHTFATRALAMGVSLEKLKDMLGHEHCDTTLIYAKTEVDQMKHEYRMAFGN